MEKNKIRGLFACFVITLFSLAVFAYADTKVITYSESIKKQEQTKFLVKVLKYEPYPVNPGEWFNLWVKVENTGEDDAVNAQFELVADYPFIADDNLISNYGRIPGTVNAYSNRFASDNGTDLNQVLLKYRVKVADNAAGGTYNLKLNTLVDASNSFKYAYDLPIEIEKTKTDFDIKLQNINPQESSFIITNIGDNIAQAVRLDIKQQDGVNFLKNAEPVLLGDLDKGDFTTAHIKVVPQSGSKSITLEISYTDKAGIRTTLEKTVSVEQSMIADICVQPSDKSYLKVTNFIIGFLTGAFLVIILIIIRQMIRHKKHSSK